MILTSEQRLALGLDSDDSDDNAQLADAIIDVHRKWPMENGVVEVPYVHVNRLSTKSQNNWDKAMAELASKTCVRFVPRKSETRYVRVSGSSGCSSSVGMTSTNRLNIGDNCAYGSFVHEMMHTLGMYHEQSRPDRDQYVDIDFGNVHDRFRGNFLTCQNCHTMNVPYEYGSVMHYGAFAFAKDRSKKTITTKTGASIGQRSHMTELDAKSVNTLYGCSTGPSPNPAPAPSPTPKPVTPRPAPRPTPKPVTPRPAPTPKPKPVSPPAPGVCTCSGRTNSRGQGGAKCDKSRWCYTEPDACSDGRPSSMVR